MVSSPSSSPILRPSSSPNLYRSLTRQLSPPVPARIRCRDSVHSISAAAGTRTTPEATRSPPPTSADSLYEILGISMGASADEIKAAYRSLARICHPDVAVSDADGGEFIRIHEAYSILSDPDKRANYDRELVRWRIRPQGTFNGISASPSSSFCNYPRRNWETDQCW